MVDAPEINAVNLELGKVTSLLETMQKSGVSIYSDSSIQQIRPLLDSLMEKTLDLGSLISQKKITEAEYLDIQTKIRAVNESYKDAVSHKDESYRMKFLNKVAAVAGTGILETTADVGVWVKENVANPFAKLKKYVFWGGGFIIGLYALTQINTVLKFFKGKK